jgi:hypothetical protein
MTAVETLAQSMRLPGDLVDAVIAAGADQRPRLILDHDEA